MRALLVTTVRNEAPYFLEWVAHHLELGFTDIVIFQSDSTDPTHKALFTLRKIGAIQYFYNRASADLRQARAYARVAKGEAYKAADWAMALDTDEFLVVKTGKGRLQDLIKAVPESDCLHLNRRRFGNSGYETLTDQLVTERFTMADHPLGGAEQFAPYKCLFRPSMFERPGPHQPQDPLVAADTLRYANGSGLRGGNYAVSDDTSTDPEGCKFAQINHYGVRDLASFVLKSEGRVAKLADRRARQQEWKLHNTNFELDHSMQPWLARLKARMTTLDAASDGQLMDLREGAIYTHLAQYYTMLQAPQVRALRSYCKDNPNAKDSRKPKRTKASPEPRAKVSVKKSARSSVE